MTTSTANSEIENVLRDLLEDEGYKLNIKASMDDKEWYIEIIKNQESGVERIQDFYHAFFKSLSRLNNKGCKHIVIAMEQNMRKILPVRAKIYKVAWKRISEAFPELEIWIVDTETRKYQKTSWIYWLRQKK
jgi:hypothetical protein